MKKKQLLNLIGVSEVTLYRWIERHPKITIPDPNSKLGHPFPRPVGNEGRANIWNDAEVQDWWTDNERFVSRHPEGRPCVKLSWDRNTRMWNELADPDRNRILRTEIETDGVLVWLASIDDAVWFNMTFAYDNIS